LRQKITIVSETIVYTILERYVDCTRDYDRIRNYCIYYILERYVDPTRNYNRIESCSIYYITKFRRPCWKLQS